MDRGAAPARFAIGLVQEALDRAAASLQFHVHGRARELVHQFRRHGFPAVHRENEAVAVGWNGFAGDGVARIGEDAWAEVGHDALFFEAREYRVE
jgi:hypothetical protein